MHESDMDEAHLSAVRVATAADLDDLLALNRIVQELHARAEPAVYKPWSAEAMTATAQRRLRDPAGRYFVAVSTSGGLVGYVYAVHKTVEENAFVYGTTFVELDEISVLPAARRRGVARALSSHVALWAREVGASEVRLTVRAFNDTARQAYSALGYRPLQYRFGLAVSK